MAKTMLAVRRGARSGWVVCAGLCLGLLLGALPGSWAAAADLYVLGGGGGGGGYSGSGSGCGGGGAGGYVGNEDKRDAKGGDSKSGDTVVGNGGSGGGNSGDDGDSRDGGSGGLGMGDGAYNGGNGGDIFNDGGNGGGSGGGNGGGAASGGGGGGGSGGSSGGSSGGGGGGGASVSAGILRITDAFSLLGGAGGERDNGAGSGGAGGEAAFNATSVSAKTLAMTGGAGGVSYGNGAAGGASTFSVTKTVTIEGALSVTGGNGGEGLTSNGTGGRGGNAVFGTNSTVTAAGSLSVTSGAKGSSSFDGTGGAGGAASFTAASLSAPTINLTKNDGALAFKVGTLNVTKNNTLTITGAFDGSDNIAIGNFAFDLTGVGSGETMLNVTGTGAVNINNATTISLANTIGLPVGWNATLIDTTNGTLSQTTAQAGRRLFGLTQTSSSGAPITATVTALQSFGAFQNNSLGSQSTPNLASGAAYLDWLEAGGSGIDPILMGQLETSWQSALDLGGVAAATAVRQFYGEQAVYANSSLSATAASFNALWGGQASAFVDQSLVASLHPSAVGVASPDAYASPADPACATASRIWGRGFGSWARQDAQGGLSGYKYNAQGFALGYEHVLNNRLVLGLAAAYSKGDLKVNDLGYRNRPDVMNLALYGVYTHESGLYLQGGLGYGHAWNDYSTTMLVGGRKSGTYGSDTFSANLELGYAARLPGAFVLIPSVGVDYAHLRNSGWSERVSGNPALIANRFESGRDSSVALPVGVRLNRVFAFGSNGGCIIPELRASWAYQAKQSRPSINSGFVGAPGSFTQYGIEPGRNYWRLGASVGGRFNRRVDYRVDYDFDTRSGFRGHNLMATLGVAF